MCIVNNKGGKLPNSATGVQKKKNFAKMTIQTFSYELGKKIKEIVESTKDWANKAYYSNLISFEKSVGFNEVHVRHTFENVKEYVGAMNTWKMEMGIFIEDYLFDVVKKEGYISDKAECFLSMIHFEQGLGTSTQSAIKD